MITQELVDILAINLLSHVLTGIVLADRALARFWRRAWLGFGRWARLGRLGRRARFCRR